MKICPKCKKELADDVKFCTGCGYKLDETVSDAHKTSDAHLNEDKFSYLYAPSSINALFS